MEKKMKLILALKQTENIYELLKDGPYAGFFALHIANIKSEIERQLSLLTK